MPVARNGRWNGTIRFPRPLSFLFLLNLLSPIRRLIGLIALCLAGLSPARADEGGDIALLVRHGAPELAQRLVDHYQSNADGDVTAWAQWEKQRIALQLAREQWEAALSRIAALPPNADPALRHWASARAAEAELALQRPAAARARLARAIWANESELNVQQLAEWRRLVIESYLQEQRAADAETALQRYRQDTPQPDEEDDRLAARVWLSEGRAAEAAELLVQRADPESRVWALLAQLRGRQHAPETILAQARELAHTTGAAAETRRQAWAVAAEAAQSYGDDAARIAALEQAVALGHAPSGAVLLPADADLLWDAYLHYGKELAQRAQLSFDDHQPWFDIEQRLRDKKPLEARALMATLAWQDPAHPLAAVAHQAFATSLERDGRGAVLEALYLHSKRVPSMDAIPPAVRYSLADVLLERGDVPAAARMMGQLSQPSGAEGAVAWQLARARVLLAGGSAELGIGVLDTVMQQARDLDLTQRRAALEAIGAVQALRRHAAAIDLLQRLAAASPEMDLQRELQFWLAKSYEALGDYQRAALCYLRTAYLAGEAAASDSWGQRGRYHAAVALAQEGLAGDARRLYAGLLGEDTAPAQRALALRALNQLEAVQ